MCLRIEPKALGAAVHDGRNLGGHAVEKVGNDPVEHLNQERIFLQNARVKVSCETARVGREDGP